MRGGRIEPPDDVLSKLRYGLWTQPVGGVRVIRGGSLEPEQEDLLRMLVEASRNVPRDQREKFHCLSAGDQFHVLHPGLPGRELIVYEGDIDTLEAEGLLNVSYS
jgi:hypothetical protein